MIAVIGVDIGGTKIAATLTTDGATSLIERSRPTPPEARPDALESVTDAQQALNTGRVALLAAVVALCEELIQEAAVHQVKVGAVGIGSAGQIDAVNGVVLDANENLIGWKGTPLAQSLRAALGVPVYVDNDVRVMALAECTLGAAQGYQHVLCITVGTGIGGALVMHGKLWHGAHFSAGEIGYIYGEAGQTIEQLYAGPALERRYKAQMGEPRTLKEIAAHALNGDPGCTMFIQTAAADLGKRLVPLAVFFDPEALVVGGGIPEIGDLWWQPFLHAFRSYHLDAVRELPVLKATLGNRAGMIGAALLAKGHLA
ncbi:MAG: ROK family glucokinase [Anaerolineae bacterium]